MTFGLDVFVQLIINSLTLGMLYGLVGLGLSLVFGSMEVLNIAHGAFFMFGAYIGLGAIQGLNLPPAIALLVTAATMLGFGCLLEVATVERVKADANRTMILTLAIATLVEQSVLYFWGGTFRNMPPIIPGVFAFAEYYIPYPGLLGALASLAIAIGLSQFLIRTKVGKAIRMIAYDRETSTILGINVGLIAMITFGIGASIAGVAGFLLSSTYTFYPSIGWDMLTVSFVVIVIGGVESIKGTAIAGIVYAATQNVITLYFPNYGVISGLVLLILILLVRPAGLFGKLYVERA